MPGAKVYWNGSKKGEFYTQRLTEYSFSLYLRVM